jgi:hypothetical protein
MPLKRCAGLASRRGLCQTKTQIAVITSEVCPFMNGIRTRRRQALTLYAELRSPSDSSGFGNRCLQDRLAGRLEAGNAEWDLLLSAL